MEKNKLNTKCNGFKHTEEAKIKIGLAGKGRPAWNKGTKGICKKNKTSFKKGQEAWNYIDGRSNKKQIQIKTKTLNGKTIALSHYVWCKANNIHRVPKGCVIHHLDLNRKNNNLENLQLLEDRYHRSSHNKFYKIMKEGGIANAI